MDKLDSIKLNVDVQLAEKELIKHNNNSNNNKHNTTNVKLEKE